MNKKALKKDLQTAKAIIALEEEVYGRILTNAKSVIESLLVANNKLQEDNKYLQDVINSNATADEEVSKQLTDTTTDRDLLIEDLVEMVTVQHSLLKQMGVDLAEPFIVVDE